ncbi:hypothetical protein F4803DRAFT_543659 [Xylaria telfairii]|nr:hypothetical protein F4803DRAFT_543659 [Xylaria telfairii]
MLCLPNTSHKFVFVLTPTRFLLLGLLDFLSLFFFSFFLFLKEKEERNEKKSSNLLLYLSYTSMMAILTQSASSNFVLSVVFITVTSISVSLHFLAKVHHRQVPQGPDWLCLFSTIIFNIYCALIINYIFNVSQFHALDYDLGLGFTEITNLAKLIYMTEILFGVGITSIKLSILWFYYLLFAMNRILRPIIRVTTAVCVVWFIVATLVIVFQCKPVQAYWEQLGSPDRCLESPRVLLGYELSNLFVDVVILCIPTSTVSRLQLPLSKKLPVIGIFLLGAVVCIVSILRLTAIWNPPDIIENFDFNHTYLWSTLQLGLAIVTSCLPTYGPLLPLFPQLYHYIRSYYRTLRHQSLAGRLSDRYKAQDASNQERPWIRVGNDRLDAASRSWAYGEDSNNSAQHPLQPMQSGTIIVKTQVDIVEAGYQ